MAGTGLGSAMDARGHGTTRPFRGDAPEVAQAERIRPRSRSGRVVEVVVVLVQEFAELGVVLVAEELEEFGAGGRDVHAPLRLFVAQALARRAVVGAKLGIGFHRSAVGVEGKDIGGHRPGMLVAGIGVDAVEDGIKLLLAE